MKRLSSLLGLVLAALSLLATAMPVHAGPRPIEAEGRGFLFANEYSAQLIGQGKGEHLGRCGLSIFLNLGELYSNGNLDFEGLEIQASNGDIVFASVHSEFNRTTGVITATITFITFEIPGHFADATGSARLLIVPDSDWLGEFRSPIDGTRFSWALEGTIDY
jgi:hypothetical protein